MKNQELARLFSRLADALELKGETGFRVLAYRKAARALAELTDDVAVLDAGNRLKGIPGVGAGIAKKVHEYLATGRVARYDEVTADLPAGLFRLLDIRGLGPRTVRLMYEELGVKDVEDLKRAIADGSLARLDGMGEKKVSGISYALKTSESTSERMYLDEAFELADLVLGHLRSAPGIGQLAYGGSLRRGCETVGDIDILATGRRPSALVEFFLRHPAIQKVLGSGDTKASAFFSSRGQPRQVDLRVLKNSEYGAALQYFTGSKEHNVALRALAQKQGLKLSEYGLFKGKRRMAGRTEPEVYRALGLPYIEPELREDRGELDAAATDRLPELLMARDIRADLHMHSALSDGAATMGELVQAAKLRRYTHIAIADHSVSAHYAGGLSEEALLRHCDVVDKFNSRSKGLKVLKACEVDITVGGAMDYPDPVLQRLDFVIGSIHQGFRKDATERMCFALAHPLVHCIAHPSGRLIGRRPGYDIDLDRVIETAAIHRKILEINSFYGRLDLSDIWARKAKQSGIKLAINTDAHAVSDLSWMRYGVIIARRAWLEKEDVINCLTYSKLLALLAQIRRGSG